MEIVLQPHLKIRLKQRFISRSYPKKIVSEADFHYFDPLTKHQIAVKVLKYAGKQRPMIAAYDIINSEIQIITVYPTTKQEIENRVSSKRWVKDEKN